MQFIRLAVLLLLICASVGCATATSTSTVRHPDGAKKMVYDHLADRSQQVRHGTFREWYENGQLKAEGKYVMGQRQGRWTEWYENGQKRYVGGFDQDRPLGRFDFWYEDGQRMAELRFDGKDVSPDPLYLYVRVGGKLTGDSFKVEKEGGGYRYGRVAKQVQILAPKLQECFESAIRRDASFRGGKVAIQWYVDLGGRSFGAHLAMVSFEKPQFETCIVDAFNNASFDRPKDGFVSLRKTYVLGR